ncbi:GNAT family N-acetyltransferase [Ligilactobacillus saerimneri]|nr:GNAT family N-acetyltransferase [Ligilactobacillus saerimneri]
MANIYTRPAQMNDLPMIMKIIAGAKEFLKASGSPQWQTGYPATSDIELDIKNSHAYVLLVAGQVVGYAAVVIGNEPTYHTITKGSWANTTDPYATIHRMAISQDFRGQHLSHFFMTNIITLMASQGITNIRLDTYRLNQPVQKIAAKFDFSQRGEILVDDPLDPRRIAFELNL